MEKPEKKAELYALKMPAILPDPETGQLKATEYTGPLADPDECTIPIASITLDQDVS